MCKEMKVIQLISLAKKEGLSIGSFISLYGVYMLVKCAGCEGFLYAIGSSYSASSKSKYKKMYLRMQSDLLPLMSETERLLKERSEHLLEQLLSDEPV